MAFVLCTVNPFHSPHRASGQVLNTRRWQPGCSPSRWLLTAHCRARRRPN